MQTFFCTPAKDGLAVGIRTADRTSSEMVLNARGIGKYVPRREQRKLPRAAVMAGVLVEHFDLNGLIRDLGGAPAHTPLVICNRYANWDHVADIMAPDPGLTARNVDAYVATAWFPASVQGYLTIRYGNTGQAVTLATENEAVIAATADHFRTSAAGGVAILASFECVPTRIGQSPVQGGPPNTFGAVTVIGADHSVSDILAALAIHRGLATSHTVQELEPA